MSDTLGQLYAKELMAEAEASRKCIERVPESLYEYKPHEKSMKMEHLVLTVAGIPAWITHIIEVGDVDFATFKMDSPKTTAEMVKFFDANIAKAVEVLGKVSDEELQKPFSLKMGEKVLSTDNKLNTVSSTINHLVHHRGQLTVYMRLNNIAVPKIYGPSGDDKEW